jgi:hypothetical protein
MSFETNLHKLSVNTVSKSQKNPNYFPESHTPLPFQNINFLYKAFAQNDSITRWFGVSDM